MMNIHLLSPYCLEYEFSNEDCSVLHYYSRNSSYICIYQQHKYVSFDLEPLFPYSSMKLTNSLFSLDASECHDPICAENMNLFKKSLDATASMSTLIPLLFSSIQIPLNQKNRNHPQNLPTLSPLPLPKKGGTRRTARSTDQMSSRSTTPTPRPTTSALPTVVSSADTPGRWYFSPPNPYA